MRLCLKVGRQGYLDLLCNLIFQGIIGHFFTVFDFAIIFHLQNYLLGVIIFSTMQWILNHKKQNMKRRVEKVTCFYCENHKYV